MVPAGLARSFLIIPGRALTVEITEIRENRTAPGIISESHFLVEMVGVSRCQGSSTGDAGADASLTAVFRVASYYPPGYEPT